MTESRNLSEKRKGEIAILIVKKKLRDEGIRLQDLKKQVAKGAEDIGVPANELEVFVEGIVREMVEETFRTDLRR